MRSSLLGQAAAQGFKERAQECSIASMATAAARIIKSSSPGWTSTVYVSLIRSQRLLTSATLRPFRSNVYSWSWRRARSSSRSPAGWGGPSRSGGPGYWGERNVSRFIPAYRTTRSSEELTLVRSVAVGGCTVVSCGNLVRAEGGLREIGLDLTKEYGELESCIGVGTVPQERWRPLTMEMFRAAQEMGLEAAATPKAVDMGRCVSCGLCEVGCSTGARWDSRKFLGEAVRAGGMVRPETKVNRVVLDGGKAVGVQVETAGRLETIRGDAVVLAAGGIGTAQILRASGIAPSDTLWADLVLTVGGRAEGARQLGGRPWCGSPSGTGTSSLRTWTCSPTGSTAPGGTWGSATGSG